jgi:hypothetical protein
MHPATTKSVEYSSQYPSIVKWGEFLLIVFCIKALMILSFDPYSYNDKYRDDYDAQHLRHQVHCV